jgi:benzoyl-CoA reductase subunit C
MLALERFHTISSAPLSQWHDYFPGRRPVGIYNAYVPEEMFQAAGLTPVYVFHRTGDHGHAQSHLPSFACWPSRSLIDQAVAGDLDGLVGIAFAQTCDTVQALTDICRSIWRNDASPLRVFHIGVPVQLEPQVSRSYLIDELGKLHRLLGEPSTAALRQAFAVYNRTRDLTQRLYRRAPDLPPSDLYAALRAGLLMPKEEYNALLADFLNGKPPVSGDSKPRLVLVGPHLAEPMLYELIEAAGACVVDDLLDVGHRYISPVVLDDPDPISALADRLLATLPTPTKYHPSRRRDEYLVKTVIENEADGVIFARQKFCDPHGFDYANAKSALDRNGIAHALVELEQTSQAGQMRTRIQAFIETLSN